MSKTCTLLSENQTLPPLYYSREWERLLRSQFELKIHIFNWKTERVYLFNLADFICQHQMLMTVWLILKWCFTPTACSKCAFATDFHLKGYLVTCGKIVFSFRRSWNLWFGCTSVNIRMYNYLSSKWISAACQEKIKLRGKD